MDHTTFDFLSQQSATILVGSGTILLSILMGFLKWLGNKFEKLSASIQESNKLTHDWLRDHEEKDQTRHIDNLYRFEKIAVALAKLGVEEKHAHP